MKIFRSRFVAVVVALAMALSIIAMPVAAASTQPTTAEEAAAFLNENALLQGDENGDLMLDNELTREQMVVILSRLMGAEDEAMEYSVDNLMFVDVPLEDEYAPYIAWAYDNMITQGYDEETFGFGDSLTAEQTKLFFVRVLGYTDLSDEEQLTKADELGITEGSTAEAKAPITRADMALLMSNTVYAENVDGEVIGEVIGVLEPEVVEPEVPVTPATVEVASAKMATDSAVKVVFSAAVADTTKVAIELKSTTVVTTTTTWNEAKTEATLTASAPLLEGTYTVTASGEGVTADKGTATFVVVKSGPAKVEFTSDKLVKVAGDADAVTLRYKVVDSYGVDITKTTLASELSVAGSVGVKAVDGFGIDLDGKGIMTLDLNGDLTDTDSKTGVVTIIASKNGVVGSGTATLTVSDKAQADSLEFSAVTFPKTSPVTTKVIVDKATAAYVPFVAKDQYGNVIEDPTVVDDSADSDVVIAKSDGTLGVTPETYTLEGSTEEALRYKITTTGITVAKSVTVTIVSKLSGKSFAFTVDIKEAAKADKVSIGSPSKVVAASDVADSLVIPITAVDQYGVQLTPDEIVTNFTASPAKLTVSGTGALAGKITIATTGENKGKIVNNLPLAATVGTAVITLSSTTSVATTTIDVKDAAYEYSIKVDTAPAANLLMDATTKMDYKFIDQYGRDIKSPNGLTVVTIESSDVDVLVATDATVTTAADATPVNSDAATLATDKKVSISTGGTEGTAKITAKLKKAAAVISTVETSITVTSGVPAGLTYEIADIPTLYAKTGSNGNDGDADGAVNGSDAYARPILLTAKDASGTTYALPTSRILSVTTEDPDGLLIVSPAALGDVAISAQDNNYVVATNEAEASFDEVNAPTTKEATIKLVISTDEGVKEVTKKVTVSREAVKVTKVVFAYNSVTPASAPVTAGNPYALVTDGREISEISGTTATVGSQKVFVYTVDQYGVYTNEANPTFTVVNMDKFLGSVVYSSNTIKFNAVQPKADENIYLMYQSGNAYNTIKVRVSDGTNTEEAVAPTAAITYSAAVGKEDDEVTITATFNELMADAFVPKVAIDYAPGGPADLAATAMTKVSATVYAYTYTVPAGDGDGTVSLSVGKDLQGNAVTAVPTSGATFTVDNTAPEVVSADFTNATTLVIVFDTAVNAVVGDFTDGKFADNSNGDAPATFTVDSIAGSGTTTITLTVTGTPAIATLDAGSVDIAATVTDLVGNAFAGSNDEVVSAF